MPFTVELMHAIVSEGHAVEMPLSLPTHFFSSPLHSMQFKAKPLEKKMIFGLTSTALHR